MTWQRWSLAKDASGGNDAVRPRQPWTSDAERPRRIPFAEDEIDVPVMGLTVEIGLDYRVTSG
jgi:hypothetical protein